MYAFDRSYFDNRLSGATGDAERQNALACRWEAIKLAVAHCDVVAGHGIAFSRSLRVWQRGGPAENHPPSLVAGDCTADIVKTGTPVVHILGDLNATLTVSGHCEIVIGGTIRPEAGISGEGFVHAFVGGDVAGFLRNTGSSVIWIDGDLSGEIATGEPSTHLHVMGNLDGTVKPIGKAPLLWLEVGGFMSRKSLESVASYRYTQFNATVGLSDQPEGIHPSEGYQRREDGRSSYLRWAVHAYSSGRTDVTAEP